MKKAISLILALVLCLGLCACGATDSQKTNEPETYAKVTFTDGTSEIFEVGEIPKMVHENVYAYNNKYAGNKIEIVTTVTDIGSGYGTPGFVSINFAGGWNCFLKESKSVILDLRDGMLVKVTGELSTNSWSISGARVSILE